MDSIELFKQAEVAWDAENYDEAIKKFDQCLCSNPSPAVAMKAYVNIGVMIHTKFRFGFRRGDQVSDEECRWAIRVGICGQKAVEIYKNHIADTAYASGDLHELFIQAKGIHQFGTTYCLTERDTYGKLVFRDNASLCSTNLPTIYSIADEENRQLENMRGKNKDEQQRSYTDLNTLVSIGNNLGVSAAIVTLILSSVLIKTVVNNPVGFCCFPIMLAVIAYFVTPTVIKSLRKE